VRWYDGLPLTTPTQTFVDLVDILPDHDLIAAGAGLLCWKQPLATREEIESAIDAHKGRPGQKRLRTAVTALVERSRSRPETLYRLAFLRAGLPMPKLNVKIRINDHRDAAPDMAWWPARVAVEYEGEHHRTEQDQWQYDLDRYNDMADADWEVRRLSGTSRAAIEANVAKIDSLLRKRWDDSRPDPEVIPDTTA